MSVGHHKVFHLPQNPPMGLGDVPEERRVSGGHVPSPVLPTSSTDASLLPEGLGRLLKAAGASRGL